MAKDLIKKVLITGANGFIGSHLCEYLYKANYDVRAVCEYNSFGSLGHLEGRDFVKNIEVFNADIRDANHCKKLLEGVDAVFHLAALIAIPYSYEAVQSYFDTNVMGSMNLLLCAKEAKIKAFIQTSTSEVYGSALFLPINETHPLQAQSPYSASKIAADALATSFYKSFGLPVVIARPFNTYGPRQSARAFIPAMIIQLLSGAKEIKVGELDVYRDLNYVSDICAGFEALLGVRKDASVYNIGSGVMTSMKEVLDMLIKITKKDVKIVKDLARLRPANSEVSKLLCDASKLKKATAWQSKISLEEGLALCVQWFSQGKNLEIYKSDIYNI